MSAINPPQDFYCPITGCLLVDPVVDPEGHSYERESIIQWLNTKNFSPMTRKPLLISDLKPNLNLKNGIEAIRDQLNEDQLKIQSRIFEVENKEFSEKLKDITTHTIIKDNKLLVKVNMPDNETRPPVDVCLTIDISGSMSSIATLKGDKGETLNYGHSVLSITVCAAKTILNSLNENDNISIVTYTDKASILVDYWSVTKENKDLIEKMLDELKPLNTTNIWDGIKTSLDILKNKSPENRMKGIFLLTDGVPNIEPPQGHEYVLEQYYKKNPQFNCMINSYGFGYQLLSDLLQNISEISGGDGFAFIPDSSLLGNIFIHGIGNFLSTCCMNTSVKIILSGNTKFKDNTNVKEVKINSLKYGQDKHFIFDLKEVDDITTDVTLKLNDMIINKNECIVNDTLFEEQNARVRAYETLNQCQKAMKFNEKDISKGIIMSFLTHLEGLAQTPYIKNMIFDFEGQVREALNMTNVGEREDWFNKWGQHYLRSLHDAYQNEICNNFKDKGVMNFGGELFNTLKQEISDIFDLMPPPKSVKDNYLTYGSSGMRGGGGSRIMGAVPLAPLPTMASYNVQSGGCCARGSKIQMADTIKNVEDIKLGDKIITVDIQDGKIIKSISEIECVVNTKCEKNKEFMVKLESGSGNTLQITPYHPVYTRTMFTNKWLFPVNISVSKPELMDCTDMFTFVVKNRQHVIVEDFIFATYGHEYKGDVIEHDYFGTEKVINDLKNFDSYKYGYVHLTKDMIRRKEGKVCKIIEYTIPDYSTNVIELMMYANL